MIALLDFSKSSLAECLLDLVIPDKLFAHINYFLVLLTLNRYLDLCFVDTILKLNQSERNIIL